MWYFPNGFTSWYETFYEIVEAITYHMMQDSVPQVLTDIQDKHGQGGFYEYAFKLTNEFEELFKGTEWGIDERSNYYDTIENFLISKWNGNKQVKSLEL